MNANDQAAQRFSTDAGSLAVGNGGTTSHEAPAMPQTSKLHFFKLPAEIRNSIYREALVTPYPGVVRSFVPPALLQTSQQVRKEALSMFFSENHFEITVKRDPKHQNLDPHRKMSHVDQHAWHRFFYMWGQFNSTGADYLRYVTRITLIYQLSMDTGFGFGVDDFDKRLGFRLFNDTWEEELDDDYGEPGFEDSGSEPGDCDSDSGSDDSEEFRELDGDDIKDLEDDITELDQELSHAVSFRPSNEPPAPDFDPVGVFEMASGEFNWPNPRETHFFLYERVTSYDTNKLWVVYPIWRLTYLLWRCACDCPLAARSVDFLCEDYQYWIPGDDPYTGYDPSLFYDPDEEDHKPMGRSINGV